MRSDSDDLAGYIISSGQGTRLSFTSCHAPNGFFLSDTRATEYKTTRHPWFSLMKLKWLKIALGFYTETHLSIHIDLSVSQHLVWLLLWLYLLHMWESCRNCIFAGGLWKTQLSSPDIIMSDSPFICKSLNAMQCPWLQCKCVVTETEQSGEGQLHHGNSRSGWSSTGSVQVSVNQV